MRVIYDKWKRIITIRSHVEARNLIELPAAGGHDFIKIKIFMKKLFWSRHALNNVIGSTIKMISL